MKPFAAFLGAALLAGTLGILASCASSGSTANRVTVTEGTAPVQEKPPTEVPTSKVGLEIVSDPDRAEVWVDDNYEGLTPYIVTDVVQGWHHLILRKAGYREVSVWLQYTSDYMFYQTSLVQITGFLKIDVSPADSTITVGNVTVAPGLQELPVGSYPVLVRAFGYTDFKDNLIVSEKTVTPLSVTLAPTPFAISDLSVLHSRINPDNAGVLGVAEAQFSVSGPGTGKVDVFDQKDQLVYSNDLPAFSTWNQTFEWNLRDSNGSPLTDGEYRLVVSGQGKDGGSSQQEDTLTVDRTLKIAPRSTWSGSSGLLYAPVAEVLPPQEIQASFLGAAFSDGTTVRAPLLLGIRAGIGSRLEIDATGGIIPSTVAIPFAVGAAVRWNFLSPTREVGLEAAVEAKVSFQYDSSPTAGNVLLTDTFTDFTGIHVAVPLQLVLGPVSLLGSLGVATSLWSPYGSTSPSPLAWIYLRGGVLADLGSVTTGISATVRTQPLPGGFPALGSSAPLQVGAEATWLVPGTRVLVSGMVAGEIDSVSSYYFMGGGGLGFLY